MKNKYQRLSREERKKARIEYRESSEARNNIAKRLQRSMICGIILMIYGIVFLTISLCSDAKWWDLITNSGCILIGFIFIIMSIRVYANKVNMYLIKKK